MVVVGLAKDYAGPIWGSETEARHLRTHRKLIKNRTTTPRAQGGSGDLSTTAVSSVKKSGISEEEHGVDEFRPTTPGNSPGIGHSIET
ncbi:hypothetical protein YC2023_020901 [Brassica napus]